MLVVTILASALLTNMQSVNADSTYGVSSMEASVKEVLAAGCKPRGEGYVHVYKVRAAGKEHPAAQGAKPDFWLAGVRFDGPEGKATIGVQIFRFPTVAEAHKEIATWDDNFQRRPSGTVALTKRYLGPAEEGVYTLNPGDTPEHGCGGQIGIRKGRCFFWIQIDNRLVHKVNGSMVEPRLPDKDWHMFFRIGRILATHLDAEDKLERNRKRP